MKKRVKVNKDQYKSSKQIIINFEIIFIMNSPANKEERKQKTQKKRNENGGVGNINDYPSNDIFAFLC